MSSNSLIGEGAVFEGKFYVAGSFRIDGQFEGELKVEDHLFISPVGRLKTDTVYTKTISVAGIFIGNIDASEEVHLLSTGRVLGNIKSPKLIMEPGVVVQGQIDITGASSVNIKETVSQSQVQEQDTKKKLNFSDTESQIKIISDEDKDQPLDEK